MVDCVSLESLYLTKNWVYLNFTQEIRGAIPVMLSVTLWDYRRILELWVLLTGARHYNLAAYVLLQQSWLCLSARSGTD